MDGGVHPFPDTDLEDYKFYCFNGVPLYCQVIQDRSSNEKIDFYDMNWIHQDISRLRFSGQPYPHGIEEDRPVQFEDMKRFAHILSDNIPFVRVDFYEVNGHLYFGELTFYPLSGFGTFEPEEYNKKFGDWLILPNSKI